MMYYSLPNEYHMKKVVKICIKILNSILSDHGGGKILRERVIYGTRLAKGT